MLPNLKPELLNSALFLALQFCKVLCIKNTLRQCHVSNIIYLKQSRTIMYGLFALA